MNCSHSHTLSQVLTLYIHTNQLNPTSARYSKCIQAMVYINNPHIPLSLHMVLYLLLSFFYLFPFKYKLSILFIYYIHYCIYAPMQLLVRLRTSKPKRLYGKRKAATIFQCGIIKIHISLTRFILLIRRVQNGNLDDAALEIKWLINGTNQPSIYLLNIVNYVQSGKGRTSL